MKILILQRAWSFDGNIFTGDVEGNIYQEDAGFDFAGQAMSFYWYSPFFDFGKRSQYKRCEFIKLWFNCLKNNNINLIIKQNSEGQKARTKCLNITDQYFVWGVDSWGGNKVLAVNDEKSKLVSVGTEYTGIQLGISGSTGNKNDFSLRSFSFIDVAIINDV